MRIQTLAAIAHHPNRDAYARSFQSIVIFLTIALPWLNPFASGPSPSVMTVSFSWACIAALLGVWTYASAGMPDRDWVSAVAMAWLAAGLLSALLGLLQYFGLSTSLAPWVNGARVGEAFANLRQRNQFATLSNIGLMSLFWFVAKAKGRLTWEGVNGAATLVAAVMLAWGNAVSGSRTGLLELSVMAVLLGLWGYWREVRIRQLGVVVLLAYGIAAMVVLPMMASWGVSGHGILERISRGDPLCSSRLTLWRNVMHLISLHPWQGWGWGELDYAHFMTLYNGPRFCEILGNAHNLPLHLAVELGLPVALLVCGALVWLVVRAKPWRETDPTRQLAWGVLALIAVHSMLEYPLWYGPFQMAAGLSLGLLWRRPQAVTLPRMSAVSAHGLRAVAVTLLLAVSYAAWDYHRVSQIYLAPEQRMAAYREGTLEKIRDSWLFRDQVRFAELTLTPLTPQNAQQLNAMAHELLHFSPEARVVEKLIESALLLGRDDEARAFMQRYRAAYPQAYTQWVKARTG